MPIWHTFENKRGAPLIIKTGHQVKLGLFQGNQDKQLPEHASIVPKEKQQNQCHIEVRIFKRKPPSKYYRTVTEGSSE